MKKSFPAVFSVILATAAFFLASDSGWVAPEKIDTVETDTDHDGKIDMWHTYKDGKKIRTAKDSDGDGKTDRYTLYLKGRNLVLKEADTNFDGKIDRRLLMEWDPDKKMTLVTDRVQRIPTPGYIVIWKEEDNNFDGKIETYYEKGKKDPKPRQIGQAMNLEPTLEIPLEKKEKIKGRPSASEDRMRSMNERFGFKDESEKKGSL